MKVFRPYICGFRLSSLLSELLAYKAFYGSCLKRWQEVYPRSHWQIMSTCERRRLRSLCQGARVAARRDFLTAISSARPSKTLRAADTAKREEYRAGDGGAFVNRAGGETSPAGGVSGEGVRASGALLAGCRSAAYQKGYFYVLGEDGKVLQRFSRRMARRAS